MPYPDPAAPGAPYPMTPAPQPKAGGLVGIWVGVALIVGGIILGIVMVVSGVRTFADGFNNLQRVPISTGGTVEIDESGTRSVYIEREGPAGGASFSSGSFSGYIPNVRVEITAPDGSSIAVTPGGTSEEYTIDGRAGVRLGRFFAPTPGRYAIRVIAGDGIYPYDTIAVGEAVGLSGVGSILGGVFGGGAIVVIGIIVVIVFSVKRSKARKRLAAGPYGVGGYGVPPGAYGGVPGAYGAMPGAAWPAPPVPVPMVGGYGAPAPGAAPGWVPPPATPAAAAGMAVGAPAEAPSPPSPTAPPEATFVAPPAPPSWPAPPGAGGLPPAAPPTPWQPPGSSFEPPTAPFEPPVPTPSDNPWSSASEPPPFDPDDPPVDPTVVAPPADGDPTP